MAKTVNVSFNVTCDSVASLQVVSDIIFADMKENIQGSDEAKKISLKLDTPSCIKIREVTK